MNEENFEIIKEEWFETEKEGQHILILIVRFKDKEENSYFMGVGNSFYREDSIRNLINNELEINFNRMRNIFR